MSSTQILRIALDVPLNRLFDYLNDGFNAQLGARVIVPFSGRQLVGVIVEITDQSEVSLNKLKPVQHVFDDVVFDTKAFKLLKFCADYYHYPLGQTLVSVLPLRLRQLKPAVTRKTFTYKINTAVELPDIPKRQVVLQRVVTALKNNEALTENQLAAVSGSWRKAIKQLETWSCLHKKEVVKVRPSLPSSSLEPELNDEQASVIRTIWSAVDTFKPWLLFGVTGSGKTEVYIQLLQKILAEKNAQALILVPEINLTPQLEARFRSRLSEYPLVTLHSHLSESERLQNWQAASAGEAKIVIGTRLSVFTPMPHLKCILIDEEHDASYKQQDGMRYHARDIAIVRAKQLNVPILMGSATPSLETWHQTQKNNMVYCA